MPYQRMNEQTNKYGCEYINCIVNSHNYQHRNSKEERYEAYKFYPEVCVHL
jgi:hypothetical protein